MEMFIRAKEMGIKIYTVDKLQRVIGSMLANTDSHGHNTRGSTQSARHQKEDLGEVLRNERLGAASEKELPAASLVPFKGPFIYIHDMDEKYRPTMVREYAKPATRAEGEWPQFRTSAIGKCPFVPDPNYEQEQRRSQKRAMQQEQQRQLQQRREQQIPRTRSHIGATAANMDEPKATSPRKPLTAASNATNIANARTVPSREDRESKSLSSNLERQPSFPPMPARTEVEFVRPTKINLPREPAASGMQRSNLTSAIQSQMISSTAATGIKAGTSREVSQQLKRQVLERTHTASLSVGSIPSSHRMTDLAGALKVARAPAPQRAAKSKAQEKLGGIQEEADPHEDDIAAERAADGLKRKKAVKKDPKPGYCENCRDKYDDFDEVRVSIQYREHGRLLTSVTAHCVPPTPQICPDTVKLD
jgi:regulatory subunit for Cdc7p protein kinase